MSLHTGVDIGGTKILAVVVDDARPATVVAEGRALTPDGEDAVIDAIVGVVEQFDHEVDGVGVGIAGLVDRNGVLRIGPNLPGLRNVRVHERLAKRLGRPITVDNDATCAVWGEHVAGAARGADDVVLVTLGTGIGSGIIAEGQLVRGAHGFGGEAGHIVVDVNGPPCPCGRRGCWERLASGTGLRRLARDAAEAGLLPRAVQLAGGDVGAVRGEHVMFSAQEGDPEALAVLHTFARWVALGIGNLVTLLDSGLVVIGGGMVEAGELLMDPVRAAYATHVMDHQERLDVRIVPAQLGERAGAIGAALLAGRTAAEA